MHPMLRWTVFVTCLVLFGVSDGAIADNPLARPNQQQARAHLDRGNRLYNTRDFEAAIDEFKAGALIESVPVFFFNLGQAYRQLGRYKEAIWHYERFLEQGRPTGEVLDAVQGFLIEMRAQLANRASTMLPTEPAPGQEPSGSPQSPTAPEATRPAPSGASVSPPPTSATAASITSHESHTWSYVGWGVTAAGTIGGGITAWLAISATGLDSNSNDLGRTMSDRLDLEHQADSRHRAALIVGVGSGVAVVLGVLTLVVPARAESHATSTAWNLGVTSRGLAVYGSF
jgi:tetratricopeptide (TPR) repeat protein